MLRGKTEAETIRLNGWHVGDILEGGYCGVVDKIRLSAIGESELLAVWLDRKTGEKLRESNTTLSCREWHKVGGPETKCCPTCQSKCEIKDRREPGGEMNTSLRAPCDECKHNFTDPWHSPCLFCTHVED